MNAQWSQDSSEQSREIRLLQQALRSKNADGATPSRFLDVLDTITRESLYTRLPDRSGRRFTSFTQFVTELEPYGLGFPDKDRFEQKVRADLHHEEMPGTRRAETAARMSAMRERVGRLLREEVPEAEPYPHPGPGRGKTDGTTIGFRASRSNDREHTIARLKRDDPELAEKVVAGEMSAYAAATAKGWKSPRISLTSPEHVAESLKKYMSSEDCTLIARLLLLGG